jgi:hypothetical protein
MVSHEIQKYLIHVAIVGNFVCSMSNTYGWIAYYFSDEDDRFLVPVTSSTDVGFWVRMCITALICIATGIGLSVHNHLQPTPQMHDRMCECFYLLWSFFMAFSMRGVIGGHKYHLPVLMSLLVLPRVFVQSDRTIPLKQIVLTSAVLVTCAIVLFSSGNNEFLYHAGDIQYGWLDPMSENNEVVSFIMFLILLPVVFSIMAGYWIGHKFKGTSPIVVVLVVGVTGVMLSIFPMSLLLPVGEHLQSVHYAFRVAQFGCVVATRTFMLTDKEQDMIDFSKACIVIVLGIILESSIAIMHMSTLLLECAVVVSCIVVYNMLGSRTYETKNE